VVGLRDVPAGQRNPKDHRVESQIWIVGAACGENETSCQHPAARRLTEPFDSVQRAGGGKNLRRAMPVTRSRGAARSSGVMTAWRAFAGADDLQSSP